MATFRALALLAILLVVVAPTAPADDLPTSSSAGKSLLAEGDSLADKGDPTEAQLRYKRAFENLLPGMRRLPFRHEVKKDVTDREKLRDVLIKEIDEDQTADEFRGSELGMKALGFIPADLDLKETMVRVYSEEIAAFYDPKTKTMHLINEKGGKRKVGFIERLLGKTDGFDKDEAKTVIAHELTHALADQHYDLDAMQKAAKGNDDRALALSALIEGEATLTMFGAQMSDWEGKQTAHMPAEDLDRVFTLMMPFMKIGGGAALRSAPPILYETMLFPYLRGLVFCAHLTNKQDWKGIDSAYAEPPLSTEQILHPAKYRAEPDPPTLVELGKLDAGDGWKERGRNVVGEMQAAVLLGANNSARVAAAGWDGDSFAVFEGPEGQLGLVWLSTWDSEDDAREFTRSYLKFQTSKVAKGAPQPRDGLDFLSRNRDGVVFAVERRGADVAVVEGFNEETTKRLLGSAFMAKKTVQSSPKPPDRETKPDAAQ